MVLKLSTREKYCYGIGALGKDLVYALVATYLMVYLTDGLGVSPLFVGGLFFVARLWDAINDPLMGFIVDNTKTRFGKFRPWLLIGTLLNAVVLVLLFFNPGLDGVALYAYIAVTYILWGMTYTVMDIPYWAFIPAMSQDEKERNELSVIPRVFASIGTFTVASVGLLFVNNVMGDYETGFFYLAVMIAIIFIMTILVTVSQVKEQPTTKQNNDSFKFREIFEMLYKNDQLVVLFITIVLYSIGMYLTTGFGIYYFKYDLGDENLFSTFTIVAGVSQVLAMLLFPTFAQRFSRRSVFILSCVLPIIGFFCLYVVGTLFGANLAYLSVAGVVLFLGFGFSQVLATTMLADAVDYGEYKLGHRSESIVFSMQPLMVKFSSALQGLITGVGLTIIGYQENVAQSAQTLTGMRVMMFVIPSVLVILSLVMYLKFYRLNGAFYEEVMSAVKKDEVEPVPLLNQKRIKPQVASR